MYYRDTCGVEGLGGRVSRDSAIGVHGDEGGTVVASNRGVKG